MDIVKIILIGIITCIADIFIKKVKPEFSILVVITGSCIILIGILKYFTSSLDGAVGVFNTLKIDNNIVKCILKILGIGYLVEFGASICNDSGHSSISEKIVLAGKVSILFMCLPIIRNLIEILIEILP